MATHNMIVEGTGLDTLFFPQANSITSVQKEVAKQLPLFFHNYKSYFHNLSAKGDSYSHYPK